MVSIIDGPCSPYFVPVSYKPAGAQTLAQSGASQAMISAQAGLPEGDCVCWGIPFQVNGILAIHDRPVSIAIEPTQARWFVFMHTADQKPPEKNPDGFISSSRGNGQLGQVFATYVILYEDGAQEQVAIRGRRQVGAFQRGWGENCFEAVAFRKPQTQRALHEQYRPTSWGWSQTRVVQPDDWGWTSWLWAWENPHPEKKVAGFRFEPGENRVILSAISAGNVAAHPLRWESRQKACLKLAPGETFQPDLDEKGGTKADPAGPGPGHLGSTPPGVSPSHLAGHLQQPDPGRLQVEVLIEYTAHPEACFHLPGGQTLALGQVQAGEIEGVLQPLKPAQQTVKIKVVETAGGAGGAGQAACPWRSRRIPGPGRPAAPAQPGLV